MNRLAKGRIHISHVTVVEMNYLRALTKRGRAKFAAGWYFWAGLS